MRGNNAILKEHPCAPSMSPKLPCPSPLSLNLKNKYKFTSRGT